MSGLDELPIEAIAKQMNDEDKTVPVIVEKALPQIMPLIEAVITTVKKGGRVIYMGSGTSGRLGVLDASECPPTFGVEQDLFSGLIAGGEKAIKEAVEDAEDNVEAGSLDVAEKVTENDFLITISASGRTPYIIGGIKKAKEIGAATAAITCVANAKVSPMVDYPVELEVGDEIIRGSSRLKAGTAQKLVLNMISTISMIKLDKVYNNYMVNVQASNQKLRTRIVHIIQEITEADEQAANEAIKKCNGDLKAAVLLIKYKVDRVTAESTLEKCGFSLRRSMEFLQKEASLKLNY